MSSALLLRPCNIQGEMLLDWCKVRVSSNVANVVELMRRWEQDEQDTRYMNALTGQEDWPSSFWQPLPKSISMGGEMRGLKIVVYSLRSDTDIARQSKGVWWLPTENYFPT